MEIRPYQRAAIDAILAEYDKGCRSLLTVMATGVGKTYVFSRLYQELKSRLPGRMMVIAHTEDLVKQNAAALVSAGMNVGIEMGNQYAEDKPVISASIQSLGRSGSNRVEKFQDVDKVVIDEAHHAVTDSYRRVLDALHVGPSSDSKLLLGFTATSERADGRGLSDIFEKVAYVYGLRTALEQGYLAPLRGYRVYTETSLDGVPLSGGDFSKDELADTVNTRPRNEQIVEGWAKIAGSRKTVVFCASVQHAKDMATAFQDRGIPAQAVDGDDPERHEKMANFRDRRFQVLCVCQLLVEGHNDPSIECVVLARPTRSSVLLSQMVGRCTRLAEGKADAVVIDVADATSRYSLVTLPTLLGVQSILDTKGEKILDAIVALEYVQSQHPGIDFTKVNTLADAKTLIEQIDLMELKFPPEVESNSEFTWYKAIAGGYRMQLPKEYETKRAGSLHIFENALGRWELDGEIHENKFHGSRDTMEEMFKVADEQIRTRCGKKALATVSRAATWRGRPVTSKQKAMLTRLFPGREFPFDHMTSGDAAKVISERLMRRKK
jgi:superfamily II DNA or RNA helicase